MKSRKASVKNGKLETLVGEFTEINGTLKSAASIRVDGKIYGNIECSGDVTIGDTGWAVSNITARNLTIFGTVEGNVKVSGKLTIGENGRLIGNHTSATIQILKGGVVLGMRTVVGREGIADSP